MARKKKMTRKEKQKANPFGLHGESKYMAKQRRKREEAARRAGLPITASWVEIRNANKKREVKDE